MDGLPRDILRWFGEENDLDLALYKNPTQFTDSTTNAPYRRKSCFRRTLSLNSASLTRPQALTVSHKNHRHSSQSPITPSFLTNILTRDSRSRPLSSQAQTHHVPPSTFGSIDPCAQYYQDPDARLKLRLFLASPHNFDEAIELGFPAPGNRNIASDQQISTKSQMATRVPLEVGQNIKLSICTGNLSGPVQPSCVLKHSVPCNPPPPLDDAQQTCTVNPKTDMQPNPGKREMTLKMTLTRPDLRANSWNTIPQVVDIAGATETTKPPPAKRDPQTGNSDEEKRGKMKTVWCKLQIWK
ncbi:hypothetical protein BO78DRAFT_92512 [Aspergillus sclerotiicarbonarius CBS 121057]|uniref:Uncharacterized protein n=1 Tax=Aspergillus sclerotiicarbonarius (strain CBS 121057 / IBT 28362) TaxID=1448318 RepID=A0A319EBB0_ASPSB|nr:hypothetical protein BO78DRAFT_92512 [Aspergillus sclerotiicarbonarius CBS 121057]